MEPEGQMRRQILIALVSGVVIGAAATIGAAQAGFFGLESGQARSPRETATGDVDGCHISIEYGAPFKRGRVIWGGLRPWDQWWMPGADQATSITTSGPLMVGTLRMPAGEHTIYTMPDPDTFLLIINNETGQFHTTYHSNRDLGRTPMTLRMLTEPVEQMTFAIASHPDGGGALTLSWDDREYSVTLAGAKAAARTIQDR